ncbi:hypothetical protein pdam_00016855 [Pocillopora damicornis]|uniref:Uncharacterized protein n=1 Tax=Pocillopora damicornis TaxID=46731 RepID=A0A3M6UG66_POCDA|nr:hypothetical protein pdam_00016855 [Pocillopora damicornis]
MSSERVGEDPRPLSGAHVFTLQQVGVTKRQVIAAWLSGDKSKAEEVIRHTTMNLHHVKTISLQRYTYSKLHIFYTFFYVIF